MHKSCRDAACCKKGRGMLSRKVVTRSGRGFRGYFPSKKLNRHVEFESILERDAIQIFEGSSDVVRYQEQPTIVFYYDETGLPKKYYPDFELELENGKFFHVEVKPLAKMKKPKILKKYLAISKCYGSRQEHFVLLTEQQLRFGRTDDIYQMMNNDNLSTNQGAQ